MTWYSYIVALLTIFYVADHWSAALPQPLIPLDALGGNTDWSNFQALPNLYGPRQCHPIPQDMKLCQSVGYNQMVLPNFLDHEDVKEAITQSNMWMTLAKTKCHPDLNRFLCSLYAPVCLKGHQGEKIQPCYQLCEDVRQACRPRMNSFGYAWPPIVRCDQFPKQSNMCIPLTQKQSRSCLPCEQAVTYESIVSSFCLADTAIRTKIRDTFLNGKALGLNIVKAVKYLKSKKSVKSTPFTSRLELPCTSCSNLKDLDDSAKWLIMGRKKSEQLTEVIFITKWDKQNPALMKAVRDMRKNDQLCKSIDLGASGTEAPLEVSSTVAATTGVVPSTQSSIPIVPLYKNSKVRPPRNQGVKRDNRKRKRRRRKNNKKNRNRKPGDKKGNKKRKNKKNRKRNRKNRNRPKKGTPEFKEWRRKRREKRRLRRLNRMRSTPIPVAPY